MSRTSDLTGKRYSGLTVLRLDKHPESGKTSWFCQRDCGKQNVVTAYFLHYNKRRSCGCLPRKAEAMDNTDLTGQVLGQLTVLESARPPNDKSFVQCRCECGTGQQTDRHHRDAEQAILYRTVLGV